MTARDLHALLAHAAGGDPRPDAELVAAADPAAFTTLVRRHGPLVWGTCRRMLPDPADAADAFQAVFLALATSAHRIRTPAAVGGWLHAAAVRVCLKQKRTCARRRLREKRAARPEAGVPVADAAWDAILAAVHEEIDRLPAGERTAFVLCELQGVPAGEAAARLGWKPGTLTGRLSKARAKLLTKLSARGFAPAVGLAGVGTLTLPAEVAALGAGCVGPAAGVSPAVVALSREVTAMIATKHLAAAVLLTAGLLAGVGGVVVRADGDGGEPPAAVPPGLRVLVPALGPLPVALDFAAPLREPATVPAPNGARPVWEYKFEPKPEQRGAFVGLVNKHGQDGWEFAGVVPVSDQAPAGRPGTGGMGMGSAGGGMPGGLGGGVGRGGGAAGGEGGAASGGSGDGGSAGGMGPGAGMMGMGGSGPAQTVQLVVFKRPAGGVAAVVPPTGLLPGGVAPAGSRPTMSGRPNPPPGGNADPLTTQEQSFVTNVVGAFRASPKARFSDVVRAMEEAKPPLTPTPKALVAAWEQLRNEDAARSRPAAATPPSTPPVATVGGFQAIALKHAKAADVARTVRELFADKRTGDNWPAVIVSDDDRRNLVLFASKSTALEESVRKLVAELDAPAK